MHRICNQTWWGKKDGMNRRGSNCLNHDSFRLNDAADGMYSPSISATSVVRIVYVFSYLAQV